MTHRVETAADELSQGDFEGAADSMFGSYIADVGASTGDYSGDFDVSSSFDDYVDYGEGGGGCFAVPANGSVHKDGLVHCY